MKLFWISVCLIVLAACGKKAEDPYLRRQDSTLEGSYSTALMPVNPKAAPKVSGKAIISRYGDEFKADVRLSNAPQGVHRQYLHVGRSCPNSTMDANGDGFVDAKEASPVIGAVILPLDGDLSARGPGSHEFPTGNYTYSRSASYSMMLSSLDMRVEELPLENRVVVIYGVPASTRLPISVAAKDNMRQHEAVLIACGVLKLSFGADDEEEWSEGPEPERPRTRPRPRPRPRPDPGPQRPDGEWPDGEPWPGPDGPDGGGDGGGDEDGGGRSWWERVRDWVRCRFGGCQ